MHLLQFKKTLLSSLTVGLAAMPLLFVASCGTQDTSDSESRLEAWKPNPRTDRFTVAEVASVYSTATKVVAGKTLPESKPTLKSLYTAANAPAKFKAEFGDFTSGAEIKGYLNLGYVTSMGFQQRLVGNFEKISTWKNIKDAKGGKLFDDAFTTDARGQKIADWSDGYATAAGETHFATLSLKTNTPLGAIAVPATVTIYNVNGEIQADVTNVSDVRVPLIGTVIKAQGLKIHLKAYPHVKGWLVYGAATVKLEQFQDALKPDMMATTVDALFTWLKDSTILPL